LSAQEGHQPQGGPEGTPSEEELRAAYEAELSRLTVTDMMAQAAVSLLNIAARRMGPPPEGPAAAGAGGHAAAGAGRGDLEQVRDGIDGVRALLEILERRIPQEVRPLRDALSQLQIAYAAEVRSGPEAPAAPAGGTPPGPTGGAAGAEAPEAETPESGPGPAQASGRLWVPGS
jgi:hypothetical protein